MAATTFITTATGTYAGEAFNNAIASAKANHYFDDADDAYYAGDITTKNTYYMVNVPSCMTKEEIIDICINSPRPRCDKWSGKAGCIDNGDGTFTFFGWAPC